MLMAAGQLALKFGSDITGGPVETILQTGTRVEVLNFSVANNTPYHCSLSFNFSNVTNFFITANGNAVLMKTNSNGAPSQTFTFQDGGAPFEWSNLSPITNPFSSNVASGIYFYQTTGATINITGAICINES
jgi:hypothetical protein